MARIPSWVSPAPTVPGTGSTTTPRTSSGAAAAAASSEGLVSQLPSGILAYTFGAIDLAASLSASKLYVAVPGPASVAGRQLARAALFAGEIVAIELSADAAKSAGSGSFEVYVDDVASGAELDWTTGNQRQVATFGRGLYTFAAGAALDVRVTTDASFAPAGSLDVLVTVYVAQTATDQ